MAFRSFGLTPRSYTTTQLTDIVTKYGVTGTTEPMAIRVGTLVQNSTTGAINVYNGAAFVAGKDYTPPVAPANTVVPTITDDGTPAAGETLTATTGTWTATPTATYTYQWRVNGTAVPGATNTTFVAVQGTVTVAVTATNYAGSATAVSAGKVIA